MGYPRLSQHCLKWRLLEFFHKKLKAEYDGMWGTKEMIWGRAREADLDFNYFWGWDCESICVWNKDMIIFSKESIRIRG